MTTLILAMLALGATAALGWFAVEQVNRQPHWGAFAIFAWLAALVLFIETPQMFEKVVAGVNLTVPDLLCAFLGGVSALRFIRQWPRIAKPLVMPLLIIFVMLGFSYLRGLATFGLQRSTNEFREFFYFLSVLAFSVSFPARKLAEKVPGVAVIGGLLLVIVAAVRIPMMGGFGLSERAVPSWCALAMGQAFFLGWFWLRAADRGRIWNWVVFGFMGMAFLMLHRSVWLALLGGLAVLLAFDGQGRRRLFTTLMVGGALGVAVVGFFFGDKVMEGLDQAVEETSSEDSTFVWRMEGWLALLFPESGSSTFDLVAGRPMGAGYARTLGHSAVNAASIEDGVIPHNYYLSMLLRGGIIGLAAFVVLYAKLFRAFLQSRTLARENPYVLCALVIMVTQIIYYVAYSADMIQGLLLGGAIALATDLAEEKREEEEASCEPDSLVNVS